MATSSTSTPAAVVPPTLRDIAAARADADTARRVQSLLLRVTEKGEAVHDVAALEDVPFDQIAMSSLLLTRVNGQAGLPEQKVVIEYLKNDQKLRIPALLGMSWLPNGEGFVKQNDELYQRYIRLASMTYLEIKALLSHDTNPTDARAAIDAYVPTIRDARFTDWSRMGWAQTAEGVYDSDDMVDMVMAAVSALVRANCDIRDWGFLLTEDGTCSDGAWKSAEEVPKERLDIKLHSSTLQSVAAMNMDAVGGYALAAWTRAYGLGMGILPSRRSLTVKETIFTTRPPTQANRTAVCNFEREYEHPMFFLCANIIAMFGIFHLGKDHTYRTGDANMERIGNSYIRALRTAVTDDTVNRMLANREAICRTAAHPFGLGQTYFVARVMNRYKQLTTPLEVRITTTPPPVQRIMIVVAAANEWENLPAGRALSTSFDLQIAAARDASQLILDCPPAYSALHKLYDVEAQLVPSTAANAAVTALMGPVYGFIKATHQTDRGDKDGLGYAMSLVNVERDMKAVANMWHDLWERYMAEMGKTELIPFVHQVQIVEREVQQG